MAGQFPRPARAPHQLPPGRHGLPRSFVARNQKERLLAAVAEATSEHGYARTSVQDVVAKAGVSRRTFYEHFRNKEDVFLQAYERVAALLVAGVRSAMEAESTFEMRIAAGFAALLDILAASPAFARMCVVEVMAAGPEAVAKRTEAMAQITQLIRDSAGSSPGARDGTVPAMHAEAIIAGAYEAIYRLIAAERIEALPGLLPDLTQAALLPYVGEEQAKAMSGAVAAQ
jgi:AcrR family transcriptional regulator